MADSSVSGSVIGAVANTAMIPIQYAMNNRQSMRMATYNNLQNRQNMILQNALNVANQNSQRLYDSPSEQMKRLTDAGINAFTAQDKLQSDTGIGVSGVSSFPSNAVASPINFDLSSLVEALKSVEDRRFQRDESEKERNLQRELLERNINSALNLANLNNSYDFLKTTFQIQSDLSKMREMNQFTAGEAEKQRKWQSSERSLSEQFQRDTQLMLEKARNDFMRDMSEKQNKFTNDQYEFQKARDFEYKKKYFDEFGMPGSVSAPGFSMSRSYIP